MKNLILQYKKYKHSKRQEQRTKQKHKNNDSIKLQKVFSHHTMIIIMTVYGLSTVSASNKRANHAFHFSTASVSQYSMLTIRAKL